jgi:hypothetical protein
MAIGNMGLDGENGHQRGLKGVDGHCKARLLNDARRAAIDFSSPERPCQK